MNITHWPSVWVLQGNLANLRAKMVAGTLVGALVLSHPELSKVEMPTELSVNGTSNVFTG